MLQLRSSHPSATTKILRRSAITLFLLLIFSASTVQAATVTLSWDPNPEPDIAGYVLSYGTSSGNYSTSVDVGKVTTWSVTLSPGFRYYFAVQAYNTSGVRSAFSTEVSTVVQANAPNIASLSPTSGNVGTSVTVSGANFGTTQGSSAVRFNGTVATPTSWSTSTIVAPVPAGATSGTVVVTVGGVASNGVTFAVTSSGLPAPWSSQDVGNPALAGQASHASGTFSVSGAGTDIWYSSDQFRFVYQPLNGDGQIVARVASLQNVDQWTKVGVMIRQDLAADAPNAMAEVTAANGMVFQSRATRGGASTSVKGLAGAAPQWVRVVRSGNTFSGYFSANGTTWTLIGTSTVTMPAQAYVGLAVTSHNPSATAAASFTDVAVSGGSVPSNSAPTLTQPANQTSAEGSSPSVQLAASDPDGNPLTYSATGLPASLSVNPTSGLISGTLTFTSAGTYSVTATVSDGSLSNSQTFTWTVSDVSQGPSITSLSPTSGAAGTAVTINGANFGTTQGTSTVKFNGTTATPTSWTATQIVVAVPAAATTGPVIVTTGSGASNGVTFTVSSSAPSITSLSPSSGVVGTAVTIAGANFGATQGSSGVRFNGTVATPTSWSANTIVVPVPAGATTGPVAVTVNAP